MFYLGGMTLGYFAPPARKTAVRKEGIVSRSSPRDICDARDDEEQHRNEQEWARAFLTPWHLLY
jgi:hypothetical protein